jgi:hypothetical protein
MNNQATQIYIREAKAYLKPLVMAEHLSERALLKKKNAFYDACASLVFLAFSIEAFCNHIGWKLAPDFAAFDDLCAKDKLRRVAELVNFPLKLGERPFQTFTEVYKFRNMMAHSRTQEVKVERTVPRPSPGTPTELPKLPPMEWEAYCTPENLIKAIADVRNGLKSLYDASALAAKCPFDKESLSLKMSWRIELDEKGQQGGPGYPPQGVGSPDP